MLSRIASITAALAVLALLQAPSAGAVPGGAPLDVPANTSQGCEGFSFVSVQVPSCTFFGFDSAGAFTSQTPPGRWVINQARARTGPRVGPMVFTALRALRSKAGTEGIACCTTVAESQVFVPQPNTVNTVGVNMPVVNTVEVIDNEQIEVVDYLGITLLDSASSAPLHLAPGSTAIGSYFIPALRNGQTGAGPGTFNARVLVNAEYQPAGSGPLPPTPVALTDPFAVQRSRTATPRHPRAACRAGAGTRDPESRLTSQSPRGKRGDDLPSRRNRQPAFVCQAQGQGSSRPKAEAGQRCACQRPRGRNGQDRTAPDPLGPQAARQAGPAEAPDHAHLHAQRRLTH